MNLAGINIDVKSTERTSGDKQRKDSTTQCHGLLALVCHNVQSGEIVRLDICSGSSSSRSCCCTWRRATRSSR